MEASAQPRRWGVLLTGGRSARLGVDKARVVVDGITLARRCAQCLVAVCDAAVEVGDGDSGLQHVREIPVGSGPLNAFLAGVDALECSGGILQPGDAVLLLACDQPRMNADVLRVLLDDPRPTCVPYIDGHLQFASAKYAPSDIALMREQFAKGVAGFRWLGARHSEIAIEASAFQGVGGISVFHDLDTPLDAAALGIDIAP